MSTEREVQLEETIMACKYSEGVAAFLELLTIRREKHRDKLEASDSPEIRGRAKECKDIFQLFS